MKSMDLLEVVGSIRDKYILEAHSQTTAPKKRIPSRRPVLIAAIIALILLLVGCVVYILGLKDMYLGEYTKTNDGSPEVMNRNALEAIADTFRFHYTPQKPEAETLVEPDWFTEATEPENVTIPAENTVTIPINVGSWEEAKTKFKSILSGESGFFDRDRAEGVTIKQYCESFADVIEANVSITKYTTADLDADGIQELILWITINDTNDYGVLVLRYDGEVNGYTFAYRQMADIKTDGTFHYSGGASNHGTARLKFTDSGWEYVMIGGVEERDSVTSFFWNGEPVAEDVFWVCFEPQSQKENVEWHAYPSTGYTFD